MIICAMVKTWCVAYGHPSHNEWNPYNRCIYIYYSIPMNGLLTTPNMDIIHPVAMKHMSAWQPRNMSP